MISICRICTPHFADVPDIGTCPDGDIGCLQYRTRYRVQYRDILVPISGHHVPISGFGKAPDDNRDSGLIKKLDASKPCRAQVTVFSPTRTGHGSSVIFPGRNGPASPSESAAGRTRPPGHSRPFCQLEVNLGCRLNAYEAHLYPAHWHPGTCARS